MLHVVDGTNLRIRRTSLRRAPARDYLYVQILRETCKTLGNLAEIIVYTFDRPPKGLPMTPNSDDVPGGTQSAQYKLFTALRDERTRIIGYPSGQALLAPSSLFPRSFGSLRSRGEVGCVPQAGDGRIVPRDVRLHT